MPAAEQARDSTHVAIVEDDADASESLAASIRAQDWLQLGASYRTGAATLVGFSQQAPNVLLVDLGLPDMSGLDVIRFVTERHKHCDVLVISMFGDEANVSAALEAGASGYLLRPICCM